MMKESELRLCCGCAECAALCPKGAISMVPDERGFSKPRTDAEKCISCGICTEQCVLSRAETLKVQFLKVYGAQNHSKEIRIKSSSGGLFSAFAEHVLSQNGAVYGAVSLGSEVKHIRISDLSDLPPLRGSKYVQSRLPSDVYKQIEKDLGANIPVLFSGTPCQCAAVENYAQKRKLQTEKLYIVDFICHGTPSPRVFEDYIAYCESKAKKQIKAHVFRTKDKGWGTHHEKNIFSDGRHDSISFPSQLHKKIFVSSYTLNEACFECKFSDSKRVSDITMADFWGIQKSHPEKNDKTGVSALLVNTPKGERLLSGLSDIALFDAELGDLRQWNLHGPTRKPKKADAFWAAYQSEGFLPAVKRFCGADMLGKTLYYASLPIPMKLKKFIKRLVKRKK